MRRVVYCVTGQILLPAAYIGSELLPRYGITLILEILDYVQKSATWTLFSFQFLALINILLVVFSANLPSGFEVGKYSAGRKRRS